MKASPFRMTTWNFGPGTKLDLAFLMTTAYLIFLQEAGDRVMDIHDVLDKKRKSGQPWGLISGVEAGQSSTPLLWSKKRVRLIRTSRVLLAVEQYIGPGTGPDRMKQKWLIGGLFQDKVTGRKFWAYSVHMVVDQGEPKRKQVALAMMNKITLRVKALSRAVFIGGDWNTVEGTQVMQTLLRMRGMRATDPVESHGNWKPDRIVYSTRSWITLVDTTTVENESDHDAVQGDFAFDPKKKAA